MRQRLLWVTLATLIILFFCSSCAYSPAYLIGGRVTGGKDELHISLPELADRDDIIMIAKETGQSLGYNIDKEISGKDYTVVMMSISSDSAIKKHVLPTGPTTRISIMKPSKKVGEHYKRVCPPELFDQNIYCNQVAPIILLSHSGLWGAGGKEEANKLLDQFKQELLARANANRK